MMLSEAQALIVWARKHRVKSIAIDGLSFELFEPGEKRPKIQASPEKSPPHSPSLPTLDQINEFIYRDPPEETLS